jgi:hypothetical protein
VTPQTRASLVGYLGGGPAYAVIESESAPLLNTLQKFEWVWGLRPQRVQGSALALLPSQTESGGVLAVRRLDNPAVLAVPRE